MRLLKTRMYAVILGGHGVFFEAYTRTASWPGPRKDPSRLPNPLDHSPAVRTSSVWHLLICSASTGSQDLVVVRLPPAKNRAGEKKGWGVRRQRNNDDDDAEERRDKPNLLALRKKARTGLLPPPQRQNDDSSLHCPSECSPFTIGGVRVGQQPLPPSPSHWLAD